MSGACKKLFKKKEAAEEYNREATIEWIGKPVQLLMQTLSGS